MNTIIKCQRCQEDKDVSEFSKDVRRKNGVCIYCKTCEKVRRREYYMSHRKREKANRDKYNQTYPERVRQMNTDCHKRRRDKLKKELAELLGGKCCVCGYNRCIKALDFHHIDPLTKSFGISDAITKKTPVEQLRLEVQKCSLLCRNCHTEVHEGLINAPKVNSQP